MEENFYVDFPADDPEVLDASDNVEEQKVKELERKNKELQEEIIKTENYWTRENQQDKIRFAIAELEKVNDFLKNEIMECVELLKHEKNDELYIQAVDARISMCLNTKAQIFQQIQELKE